MAAKTVKKPLEKKESNEHILVHTYNPKFELLKEEEVKDLLERFDCTLIQLPKMNLNDPICRLFKAKVNDVFKITRKSYTSEESIFYRVVVDG